MSKKSSPSRAPQLLVVHQELDNVDRSSVLLTVGAFVRASELCFRMIT